MLKKNATGCSRRTRKLIRGTALLFLLLNLSGCAGLKETVEVPGPERVVTLPQFYLLPHEVPTLRGPTAKDLTVQRDECLAVVKQANTRLGDISTWIDMEVMRVKPPPSP